MSAAPTLPRTAARCAAAVAITAGLLLVSAKAEAKLTCDAQGPRGGVLLRGVPSVAKHASVVEAYVPGGRKHVVYEQPRIGAIRCPRSAPRSNTATRPEDVLWIDPAEDLERNALHGRYAFRLRFPYPGHWKLAVFDRRGRFRDLGTWDVGPAPARQAAGDPLGGSAAGAGDGGLSTSTVLVAIAIGTALVAVGAILVSRRRRAA